jgi:hypothetical protein
MKKQAFETYERYEDTLPFGASIFTIAQKDNYKRQAGAKG